MTDTGYALTVISDTEAEMTRLFHAPRELVFQAYTDPAAVTAWWGPRGYTTTVETMDVRPGGAYRFLQSDPDGNEYAFRGEYLEIVPNEKVVNTFIFEPMPEHVITDAASFTDEDGQTRVTVRSTTTDPESLKGMMESGMEQGAIESWDRLAEYLDAQQA